jgi:putative glycosyltransferase (TIGR04372 family)
MIFGRIIRLTAKNSIVPILSILIKKSKFRIAVVPTDRLGHLALNTHLFFIREKIGSLEHLNYLLITPSKKSSKVANASLLHMFIEYSKNIKNVHFICSTSVYFFFNFFRSEFSSFKVIYDFPMNSCESEFALGIQTIDFSETQKKYGESLFKKMPVSQNKKIVTIFARDSSFLDNKFPKEDWSYHSSRNADIETFVDSIKYLISEGYVVIRIGSEYSKKLNFIDENYFEYSLSKFKSSFMDLYLVKMSSFVLGTTSGAIDISTVFNVPLVGVNFAPFMLFPLGKNDIFIQKKIKNSNGKILLFKDIISKKEYYSFTGLDDFQLKYFDNTSEEILIATKEMHHIQNGLFSPNNFQSMLLKKYHSEYCQKNNWSQKLAPISISWLEKNYHLYLENTDEELKL